MQHALLRAARPASRGRDASAPADDGAAINTIKGALARLEHGQAPEAVRALDTLQPLQMRTAPACALAGLICVSAAEPRKALAWLDRALVLGPADPSILGHRASALAAIGDGRQALAGYEAAVAAGSDDPVLHYNRGNLLRDVGRVDDAIASYDNALRLQPAFPEALRAGGQVLRDVGHAEGALRFFGEALRLRPADRDTWIDRTNLLQGLNRPGEALADLDRALFHLPDDARLLANRGIALIELGRLEDACACFDASLRSDPALPQAHLNRGNVLVWLGHPDKALDSFDRALAAKPAYPEALCGRGLALKLLGRYDEALDAFEASLAEHPNFAHARANRGELHLLRGDFAKGWPDYEFRFLAGRQERVGLDPAVPTWMGEPCRGKRLAVFADQGNGDKIQFVRFLPLVAATGAEVTFVCPARLQTLFAPLAAGVHVVEAVADADAFDLQVGLSSLPACFRTTPDTIPAAAGYLAADPALVERWGERLGPDALKVGVCWRGNQNWQVDPRRSLAPALFAPLAAIPDVRLLSLQLPDADDAAVKAAGIESLGDGLDAGPDAFADTAAAISHCDLVVTCDTAIAHLAGALGKPVWLLLQAVPEWRWMLGTDESPWYGSMRLFRQEARGDWTAPLSLLTAAVEQWAQAWRAQRAALLAAREPMLVPMAVGDVLDRMTILSLKRDRLADPAKQANVGRELTLLEETLRAAAPAFGGRVARLVGDLATVNETLWDVEDDIRACEARGDFGPAFVALARAVYTNNDRRAALKREINLALGSALMEEKGYRAG